MKLNSCIARVLVAVIFLCSGFIGINEKEISDFSLKSTEGKTVSLRDYPEAKGFIVVFTCNHCPFAKLYPDRLNRLNSKYQSLGIPLLAISSTDPLIYEEDSFDEMIKYSKENNFIFPYLCDQTQEVAKLFHAEKTPHAYVLWKENNQWKIKYNGAIDDNGAEPENVSHAYVEEAVDALLNGKMIAVTETKSIGCSIRFKNQ